MGLLRVILAITVVIAHSAPFFGFRFTGGLIAVEIFFMISGFYMTMILNRKYIGKGSILLFFSNRFLRLYPIYWVVLLLTIAASIASYFFMGNWFRLAPYMEHWQALEVGTIIFQIATNLALFGQDVVMFLGVNKETGGMYFTHDFRLSSPMFFIFLLVPQAWSLGVELAFYLIAPFIVRKNVIYIVMLIIGSMLARIFTYFYLGYTNDPWTYRFFPSELALFLMGSVSYRLYDSYKIQNITILKKSPSYFIVAFLVLMVVFYQFIPKAGFGHIINWLFYGVCFLSIPFLFEISRSSRIDSRIGELSYPIYISHTLVIASISPFISLLRLQNYQGELAVVCTILVSYLLVVLISDPIEKIRQSRVKK